jgi:hypothetical protein
MTRQAVCSVLVVLLSGCGPAYIPHREPWPTDPGALAAFLGEWSGEGEVRAGNAHGAPAGRYTYTERYDWRPGDFLLEMRRTGQGPAGEIRHSLTLGYHVTTRQYSLMGTDLMTGAEPMRAACGRFRASPISAISGTFTNAAP